MSDASGPLRGLSAIAHGYEAAFCDVWGVVHNGLSAYPLACEALVQFRAQGRAVVLVTNAPRPSGPIIERLDQLSVPKEAYDAVVSSGDATRAMIAPYAGRVVHHVGPPLIDDALYAGLGVTLGRAEEAEVVVITDLEDDDDLPEMYNDRMAQWLARGLPLICANPDKIVEHGDQLIYCGGAVADLYAERGGTVLMAGKPYAPIYEEALRLAQAALGRDVPRDRILAIGDSVRTDATGAAGFGLDLLFVTGSIHAAELDAFGAPDPKLISELVAPSGARLAGYMSRLAW